MFVGINHHDQSVLLGCGLLASETTRKNLLLMSNQETQAPCWKPNVLSNYNLKWKKCWTITHGWPHRNLISWLRSAFWSRETDGRLRISKYSRTAGEVRWISSCFLFTDIYVSMHSACSLSMGWKRLHLNTFFTVEERLLASAFMFLITTLVATIILTVYNGLISYFEVPYKL